MRYEDILQRIINGQRMSETEFIQLYLEADILALGRAANLIREQRFSNNIATFVIDRNINYTNICSCKCKFCAFYRSREDADAYVLDKESMFAKIEEALQLGASQLMIQGGLNEDLKIDYFIEMFSSIKARFDICIHSLTAPEIVNIAKISSLSIRETLLKLQDAGLDSLPGGGAEVLHDDVRSYISPQKIKVAEWLEVMRTAHQIGMKTTATMMMGSVDKLEHRLHHLKVIRDLQDETGGFRAFIPWTYQPRNNELLGTKISSLEYLRFLSLARLYLDNFDHIQCSWLTQGKAIGQLSLLFGGDDLGSIMIEENVVRSAGLVYKMSREEMISLIRGAGRIPALRDTEYGIIEVYG
ncbi:cyclic dehypoxanthinyl futalosine synthase [Syntrophomonas palmitatica]|uniref:cyclic dehypoxanthinyl futalosine synthase n=1 Tax=Syntrophomonas palmitatica TaxID=402877 RepID=UPI000A4FB7B7|nr:cyclic dehypoxanthinyl futalosine synthase [Syntrophomonas palmitatica]